MIRCQQSAVRLIMLKLKPQTSQLKAPIMIKNYVKIAIRNLVNSKIYSLINVVGLAVGLAVVLIIGIWIRDELNYNTSIPEYKRLVQVLQNQTNNGKTETQESVPPILADELKKLYSDDFEYVAQTSWSYDHLLTYEKKTF